MESLMRKLRSLLILICTLCYGFDDVFEDIPSPFNGMNVFIGFGGQANYGEVSIEANKHPSVFIPKGFIELSYNKDSGLWVNGMSATLGISAGEYILSETNARTLYTQLPLDIGLNVHRGFMPNPSTLMKVHVGGGRAAINQGISSGGNTKVEDHYLYFESGASITVNLLTTLGVEIGVSGRFHSIEDITVNTETISHDESKTSWIAKIGAVYQKETKMA